jgi:hypothetical protein
LPIDFSNINLGDSTIYITNNLVFDSTTDFAEVREYGKDVFSAVKLSHYYDAYYFVRTATGEYYDFDIYLEKSIRD